MIEGLGECQVGDSNENPLKDITNKSEVEEIANSGGKEKNNQENIADSNDLTESKFIEFGDRPKSKEDDENSEEEKDNVLDQGSKSKKNELPSGRMEEIQGQPISACDPRMTKVTALDQAVLSFTFQYKNITESGVIDKFNLYCSEKGMQIISVEATKITAKKRISLIQKMFKLCVPSDKVDDEVYMFKVSGRFIGQMKLIQISGDQLNFIAFWQHFSHQLWQKGWLKCPIMEDIHHFLKNQKSQLDHLNQILTNSKDMVADFKILLKTQAKLWNKYQDHFKKCDDTPITPLISKFFQNSFYQTIQLITKVGETDFQEKNIGCLERKKMIVKGTMPTLSILDYLQLKEDFGHIIPDLQKDEENEKGKMFKKSMYILNSLTSAKYCSPHQWMNFLTSFIYSVKDEAKSYLLKKEQQLNQQTLQKLYTLCLLLCDNREIWAIIRSCTIMEKANSSKTEEQILVQLEEAIKFLQQEWQI